ncbi:MAG: site-specific DNA-methyltransferase [Caldilineaceae bacterium]
MSKRAPIRKKKSPVAPPVLSWPDKRSPEPLTPPTVELIEIFDPNNEYLDVPNAQPLAPSPLPPALCRNHLFYGDNLATLTYLLANGYRGQVKLIYIDPPYASGVKWQRKVRLRGPKAPTMQTSADHVFAAQEQYNDQWSDNEYLQFMYERLPLLRDLLADDGALWLHCDHRKVHPLHILLEEVFGPDNYLNTITWRSQVARGAKVNAFYFPFSAHYIEIFAKNRRTPPVWNPPKKQLVLTEAEAAREFLHDEQGFFRTSDPGTYSFARLKAFHAEQRLYAPFGGTIVVDEATQRVYASNGGNIGVKYYLTKLANGKWAVERSIDNLWDDIPGLGTTPGEDLGYPTQKTVALLDRIVRTSTNPGDLVLDCFMGSGTTLAVAQQLGRRWIGCDNNAGAVRTTRRRLQALQTSGFALYQLGADSLASKPLKVNSAYATLEITRNAEDATKIIIKIIEYVSPLIMAQLTQTAAQNTFALADWRALVDCVAIDPTYGGQVFRSVLVDAPLRKREQVKGVYTVVGPSQVTCVAVRITDLLGEELLVIQAI